MNEVIAMTNENNNSSSEILSLLTDEDIKVIINSTSLNNMLIPFKKNARTYAKYMNLLGRMDPKSLLVQKNLPRITFELYKKGDIGITTMLASSAGNLKAILITILEELNLSLDDIREKSADEIVYMLINYSKGKENSVGIDLFFVQLKMHLVVLEEEKVLKIRELWKDYVSQVDNETKNQELINEAVRGKEEEYRDQLKFQKKEYQYKISQLEENEKKLTETNKELSQCAENYKKEIKSLNNYILDKIKEYEEQETIIAEYKEYTTKLEAECKELSQKYEKAKLEYQKEWEEELKEKNTKLISDIRAYEDDIKNMELRLEDLNKAYTYKKSQTNNEDNYRYEEVLAEDNEILSEKNYNKPSADIATDNLNNSFPQNITIGDRLYMEQGVSHLESGSVENYEEYVRVVEANLDSINYIGDKKAVYMLTDTAMENGIVPTICGFGSRKLAMALVAAKYGEIPTIISVPSGYTDVDTLSEKIDMSDSKVVVIEDLFGSGNENVILPVLRRDIEKQLIFCTEDEECLKNVPKYFYNYIEVLKSGIVLNRKMKALLYKDAAYVVAQEASLRTDKEE